jgi:ribonuclease HII
MTVPLSIPPEGVSPNERARLEVMLAFEQQAFASGFRRVAGVDEAGRGPLAGPLMAGAVVLSHAVPGLDDSKRLTEARREALFAELLAGAHAVGVGVVEAGELDRMGVQRANYTAMARAVAALAPPPDFLLVDGFNLPGVSQPCLRIIKGDQRSLSISAASIIAKVTRDRRMAELDREYPGYGFGQHKGYGTAAHLAALARLGPCPEHRRSFAPLAEMDRSGGLLLED